MKILQINKFFYLKGGAERYFFELSKLLKSHGHQVIFFSMKNQKFYDRAFSTIVENALSPYFSKEEILENEKYFVSYLNFSRVNFSLKGFKIISRMIYSLEAKRKIEELIKKTKPDIAHLHNIYHQISPSILPVLKKYKIPVVMTLHDYKLICPNYRLANSYEFTTNFTNKKIHIVCERCKGHRYYNCFLNKCVKNSYLASGLATLEMYIHKILRIYEKNIDLFIAPSQFMRDKCVEFGIDPGKIVVLPNFVSQGLEVRGQRSEVGCRKSDIRGQKSDIGNYILYFGRLSEEKGINVLLEAIKHLKSQVKLKIAGTGLMSDVRCQMSDVKCQMSNVELLGHLEGKRLQKIIQEAMFIIVPSICYENCPLSILESFALGKPVIASRIGGIPEIVEDGKTGLLFEPGNAKDLAQKIEWLIKKPEEIFRMGKEARKMAEKKFNPEEHYKELKRSLAPF